MLLKSQEKIAVIVGYISSSDLRYKIKVNYKRYISCVAQDPLTKYYLYDGTVQMLKHYLTPIRNDIYRA